MSEYNESSSRSFLLVGLLVGVDILADVTLLDLGDLNGHCSHKHLVVRRFQEGVVQTHCYFLLFWFVTQSLCAEGGLFTL